MSALDGLPEAIEAPGRRFVLGVQWHPEADERSRLIGGLVEAAQEFRNARVAQNSQLAPKQAAGRTTPAR